MPDKNNVRRFYIKTVTGQDDYASLREIVERRYKEGKFPDLIVIDGGKGQLHAVADLVGTTECVSLAKREETVFSKKLPKEGKVLDQKSIAGQQLIALRDYAHHFAISFHRLVTEKEWQDQVFNALPKK
jgi:excinuclease ABC subunit C